MYTVYLYRYFILKTMYSYEYCARTSSGSEGAPTNTIGEVSVRPYATYNILIIIK